MNVSRFVFNPFGENTYILWDDSTKEATIVDPGMSSAAENDAVDKFIAEKGLQLIHLVNTHMHIDHAIGNGHIMEKYGLVCECNETDNYLAERLTAQAQMFGIPFHGKNIAAGKHLADNSEINIGDEKLQVLYVPGHTKGHIALYSATSSFVLTGDALFQMSIGRTDLPGGNFNELINSIEQRLFKLPPETIVYPGHGGETSIGFELEHNPYI